MNTPADRLPGADEENIVPESDGLTADVPAGGAGADTGAVGATSIDPDDEAHIANVSSQNDVPGVGTRGADGHDSTSSRHEDTGSGDSDPDADASAPTSGEPHVDADDPIARFQPGVGRDSAASSRIAQGLPRED